MLLTSGLKVWWRTSVEARSMLPLLIKDGLLEGNSVIGSATAARLGGGGA